MKWKVFDVILIIVVFCLALLAASAYYDNKPHAASALEACKP